MKVELRNICKIKKADIDIDGLTIITGENDTGKSTIGKLLFSLINSNQLHDGELEELKEDIYSNIEEIYFLLRKKRKFVSNADFRREFMPPHFMRQIDKYLEYDDIESIKEIILLKKRILSGAFDNESLVEIYEKLDNILESIDLNNDDKTLLEKKLKKYLDSEFNFELTNKIGKDLAEVNIFDGENKLVELNIEKDKINKYEIRDILNFKDATYIETPLILQMYDFIRMSQRASIGRSIKYKRSNLLPLHMLDLVDKMELSRFYDDNKIDYEIGNIISGHVNFNRKNNNFSFSKVYEGVKVNFKPLNTASGIKSFGILELLINADAINKNSLLIIDEPEIHLHPEWQIEYARLICYLASSGIKVLITTHSPYMLQAFDYFSNELKENDFFRVYLTEKQEQNDLTEFRNVTYEINEAFYKLSVPLQKIMWGNVE